MIDDAKDLKTISQHFKFVEDFSYIADSTICNPLKFLVNLKRFLHISYHVRGTVITKGEKKKAIEAETIKPDIQRKLGASGNRIYKKCVCEDKK